MSDNAPLPDEPSASPPQHQSFWFPVAPESSAERSQDEPDAGIVAKIIASGAPVSIRAADFSLGWKAPSRVSRFKRDAAPENTTPVDPSPGPGEEEFVADVKRFVEEQRRDGTTPSPEASYADRAAAAALGDFDTAECRRRIEADGLGHLVMSAPPDVPTANTSSTDTAVEINPVPNGAGRDYSPQPTANDETVRRLREHIVPVPMPPDEPEAHAARDAALTFRHRQVAAGMLATAGLPLGTSADREIAVELRAQEMIPPLTYDEMVRAFPNVLTTSPADDPDFQEVRRAPVPDPDTPPKGAEAAHAPRCAVPVDRDDATPNDGVVPQETVPPPAPPTLPLHVGAAFNCALWSNGRLQIHTSDGEHVQLTAKDTRLLLRYVSDVLSTRVRAEA